MNDVYSIHHEIDVAHGDHLHHRLMDTLFYIGFTAEMASNETDNPRTTSEFIGDTFKVTAPDGYVDRRDLTYAIQRCLLHIQRMRMAYDPELEEPLLTLLQIIELCLTDTNVYIYGTTEFIPPKPNISSSLQ